MRGLCLPLSSGWLGNNSRGEEESKVEDPVWTSKRQQADSKFACVHLRESWRDSWGACDAKMQKFQVCFSVCALKLLFPL